MASRTIGNLPLQLVVGSLIASSGVAARAIHYQVEIEREACRLMAITPAESTHAVRIALYREFLLCGDMLEALKKINERVMLGELP